MNKHVHLTRANTDMDNQYYPIDIMKDAIAYITPNKNNDKTIVGLKDGSKHLVLESYDDVRRFLLS